MGGSNPNDNITALHFDSNQGMGSGIQNASVNKPWDVQSAHPEAVSQGIGSGISAFAGALPAIAGALKAPTPNAAGGYDTQSQAKSAAPHAAGYSNVQGVGWVPQAQAVDPSLQPDQMQRMYGPNYGNM